MTTHTTASHSLAALLPGVSPKEFAAALGLTVEELSDVTLSELPMTHARLDVFSRLAAWEDCIGGEAGGPSHGNA